MRSDASAARCSLVLVQARRVLAEDRALDGAVGGAERREAVLALHVLRNLEPAQRLDLPLRRAGPYRVGPPYDVVGAEALDERAHHRRAQARLGDGALREDLAEIAVDVGHAVLRGNLREVGHPVDAPGLIELLHADAVRAAGVAERRVVDDEVELRPVLRGLADVAHVGVRQQVRKSRGWSRAGTVPCARRR